ncbi:MAG TPA: hypothetical protein VK465_15415 [Fibrobacteria bacterium]|nr:hypothetical protein [Fibrobacteria bacterium]
MADYAVANGLACYDCGYTRCRCPELEAASWAAAEAEERAEQRAARLMRAIDAAEARVNFLYSLTENHPALPDAMERFNNLTRAFLNHRRAHHKERF